MSAVRLLLTPSVVAASGCALTLATAAATASRVGVSSGKESCSWTTDLPRMRPVLDSDGGRRMSTRHSLGAGAGRFADGSGQRLWIGWGHAEAQHPRPGAHRRDGGRAVG